MNTTEQILLIFLSSALAVFLLLGIVTLIKIIQLLNALKHIAVRAEQLADKANTIGDVFRKTAAPLAIGRLFANLADAVFRKDKKTKRTKKNG